MRLTRSHSFLAVAILLAANTSISFAGTGTTSTPPPANPLLTPVIGHTLYSVPTVTSPEEWTLIEDCILSVYPNADYEEICYYALSWFNALPPA